jgi:aspartate/tyrosine/aromatic aminotransferase
MIRSSLTYAERRIAAASKFDLGAGYPIGLAPDWTSLRYHLDAVGAPPRPEGAARHVLGLHSHDIGIVATFSGSIALQRSFLAARTYLERYKRRVVTVTTSPSIDIIPAIAREISDAGALRLDCGLLQHFSKNECERLCAMIGETTSDEQAVIAVISSPENPTGAIWSADHLQEIVHTCEQHGAVLIVDHCFLLAGSHETSSVSPIWNIVNSNSPVIGVWDTGKTVHLNGAKIGFILSFHQDLILHAENAVSVVQYSLPEQLSRWLASILCDRRFPEVVGDLRDAIRKNKNSLSVTVKKLGLQHLDSKAGAFDIIRTDFVNSDVGTVSLECFEDEPRYGTGWRRIALARPPDLFEEAIHCFFRQ